MSQSKSILKEVSDMEDFSREAFPWVATGFAVAIVLTYRNAKSKMINSSKFFFCKY